MWARRMDSALSSRREGAVEGETKEQRINRELTELLGELRVALPGVQLLVGFLLTVPFTERFTQLTTVQRGAFYGTFLAAMIAAILLIAPSSNHRLLFRSKNKEQILFRANKFAISGIVCLAVALLGTSYVIGSLTLAGHWAFVSVIGIAVAIALAWFVLPLRDRRAEGPTSRDEHGDPPRRDGST
jgi:hypothetical protein